MTKAEQAEIIAQPTVGYWSMLNGVELKSIEYGIEDYAICVIGAWAACPTAHRLKIRSAAWKGEYIEFDRTRMYFNDCIRC